MARYFEGIRSQNIAVLGVYPPPLGGVSIHIQRVTDFLVQHANKIHMFNVERRLRLFFPLYILRLVFWLLARRKIDQIHYHGTYAQYSNLELACIAMLKKIIRATIVVIDHDCRHMYRRSALSRRLYAWALRYGSCHVVCIGQATLQSYQDNEISLDSYSVESAFLPPFELAHARIVESYLSSLSIFMKEYTPLLMANAAHNMIVNGKDIYGLDLCIEMLTCICRTYPDVGLIIGLPLVHDVRHYAFFLSSMKDAGVAEHVYILHGNKELWPLFKKVDLFMRPTRSDGDSISIREALYFHVPVVASDVCERPDGVYLFKSGDAQDFAKTVESVFQRCVYGGREMGNFTPHERE